MTISQPVGIEICICTRSIKCVRKGERFESEEFECKVRFKGNKF